MSGAPVVVIGAGPAGLTAALTLAHAGVPVMVCEAGDRVGGIARSESYKGYRFDVGGHRFLTKVPEIEALWRDWLGDELLTVHRQSRILYDRRFFDYPLRLPNVLGNLGPLESARIVGSYARACLSPVRPEQSFADWVTNRFGDRLYRTFFKTYTEKVWGVPCDVIRADWAAQRIRGLSLTRAVSHAVFGRTDTTSLAGSFLYPRLGPGQMWERAADLVVAAGGEVVLNASVERLHHRGGEIRAVTVRRDHGTVDVPARAVISTMPLPALVSALLPSLPAAAVHAASRLTYRDFLIVVLIVAQADMFPDNWIYVHSPDVGVGRIQNFKNWSPALVPDPTRTSVGMEYFCDAGDAIWRSADDELVRLAARELQQIGLASGDTVEDGCVLRQRRAYPVYDAAYREHVDSVRTALGTIHNLQTTGRNGMHRYNNQDHSMLTGLLAARNLLGERHEIWDVNTERSYYEEQQLTRRVG